MLNKKNQILLFFALLLANASYSQYRFLSFLFPPADSLITKYDTTKVDPKLDQLTLRLYSVYNGNEFLIKSPDETTVFSANSKYKLGFGFGYRWLILNAAIISPFADRYNQNRGETFAVDVQMNTYSSRFQTDLRFQRIDGYYRKSNDEIYLNLTNNSPFEIRKDLKLRSLGAGLSYTFNKNYLHKHGFDQTKTMKKSGGTLLTGARIGYLKVFTDSILFKASSNISIQELISIYGGVSFGGAYTFLLGKNWFFSIHGALNASLKKTDAKGYSMLGTEKSQTNKFSFSPTIRSSFGYNSSKHFIGLYGIIDNELNNKIGSNTIDYYFSTIKLIYAFRIKVKD